MSELPVDQLLTVQEAIAIIDHVNVHPREAAVELTRAAGFVLAESLKTDRDFPPFDKSVMDGYAVRGADVHVGGHLRVVGEIAAGGAAKVAIAAGQAVAIMTGAPMPAGADSVVPVEDVTIAGDSIHLTRPATLGQFIARRGSDCRAGAVVLNGGTRIGPAQVAVAASVGAAKLKVFARPRVAVLSTGDEIVPIDQHPGPTQIRNSNTPMLLALLQKLNCETTDLGHVPDNPDLIREALRRGLASDALFVTGGMSMGRYDFVPRLLQELKVDLKITKVRIKPGKPFVFGVHAAGTRDQAGVIVPSFVFGLPGNPVSAFVCTLQLASRLLARLGGAPPEHRYLEARLDSPLPANGAREFYQPARLVGSLAHPMHWKGSADIFTLASADALLVRAANESALPAGATVRLLEIPR